MRILSAALAALLFLSFAVTTANARERRSGFSLGSNVFGVFDRRAKVRRARQRRAALRRRGARTAGVRRASARRSVKRRTVKRRSVKRRSVKRRSAKRRSAKRRSAGRRVARRSTARRSVKRRKVARRSAKKSTSSAKRFRRQTVAYRSNQKPGTIVVDTKTRHLYYVLGGGKAIRYGVAVGKQGFAWSGVSRVRRKVKWPTWTPPAEMIERKPELAEFRAGMPGGPKNPLGARALYLFQGKKDTLYRIHGTNNPSSIGRAASSGCIRMRNDDVAHLYARVGMGAKVIVR